MPFVESGCVASHAIQVAKPSAEYSAKLSLGTVALRRNRTADETFVGRCLDFCGLRDQKIAACGSSYRYV